MSRFWKLLRIGAISVASIVLLVVVVAAGRAYYQMRPRDTRDRRREVGEELEPRGSGPGRPRPRLEDDARREAIRDARLGIHPADAVVHLPPDSGPGAPEATSVSGFLLSSSSDGPRGVICGHSTAFPVAMARAATWDVDLERRVGELTGKEARAQGAVSRDQIDESVRRILRTKLLYVTREDPMEYGPGLAAAPEHVALAREVAEKGMVLLKNDPSLLPLDKTATRTVAVVGRLADAENTGDRGSSNVSPPHRTSALTGILDFLGTGATVLHADGSGLAEVSRVAAKADPS